MLRAALRETMRARRRAMLVVALVGGLVPSTGCVATKKDIRTLQTELLEMQVRQDSAVRALQRQNNVLMDSLRKAMTITQDASGQTTHRFAQLETTLKETQDLVGQVMQTARDLTNRLESFAAQPRQQPAQAGATTGEGSADEYYQLGVEKMADGAYGTARAAFQQLLKEFPTSERAADAQYQIGESYAAEKEYTRAVTELELVANQWPTSERAPQALYRAGVLAADSTAPRQPKKARELLERVVGTYPASPSAGLARTKLRNLPRS